MMLRLLGSFISNSFIGLRNVINKPKTLENVLKKWKSTKKKSEYMANQPDKEPIHNYHHYFEKLGEIVENVNEIKVIGKNLTNREISIKVESILNEIKKDYLKKMPEYWSVYPEKKLEEKTFYKYVEEKQLKISQPALLSDPKFFRETGDYLQGILVRLSIKDQNIIKIMNLDSSMTDEDIVKNMDAMSHFLGLIPEKRIHKAMLITDYPWVFKLARLKESNQPGLVELHSIYYECNLIFKTREMFPNGLKDRINCFREGLPPNVEKEPNVEFCFTVYIYTFLNELWKQKGILENAINNRRKGQIKEVTSEENGYASKPSISIYGVEGSYATALYSAAIKQKKLELVEREIKEFQSMLKEDAKFNEFVLNPSIMSNEKRDIILSVLTKKNFSDLTTNLIILLAENNRFGKIDGIFSAFGRIMSSHNGEVPCVVTTAKPLDAAELNELRTILKAFVKKGEVVQLETKVDPSLIGGMTVSIGDKYVDMSIASKIKTYTDLIKQPV